MLKRLVELQKTYYILGDFKINIQKFNRTNAAHNCINLIVSNGAILIITKPTRVTPESSSIMDHILTNDSNQILYYTRWITLKRATSWRGPSPDNLTGPRFEPQTSRSRDERVTARPTGRLLVLVTRDRPVGQAITRLSLEREI